jgi:hypothetical protein
MHKELGPLLGNLPPKTAQALTQAINKCGRELGMGPDWVRRWVAFTVVAESLAGYAPDGQPAFHFKGGAAIELRLRQLGTHTAGATAFMQPRATKDLGATFLGTLDAIEGAVRAALAVPHRHWAFRVEVETRETAHMRRFNVRVGYREERFGRTVDQPFSNIQLEVSAYEGTPRAPDMVAAYSLHPFGLAGPEALPCIPLTRQVAQKLHAATEVPASGRRNDRFRDLLDIVMLSALVPASTDLRTTCEETFAVRQRHAWPPEVVLHAHWREPLEQQAVAMGLAFGSADDLVASVARYITDIVATG